MKLFTQEEFDNFPIVDGYKQYPSGDYTKIKKFEDDCIFGEYCKFGEYCEFGINCSFREDCEFGNGCKFGRYCEFGRKCSFGDHCEFGNGCKFWYNCEFGRNCSFREDCEFGNECFFNEECTFGFACSFREFCVFEGKCVFETGHVAKKGYPLLGFSGFGTMNRTTYFFNCTDGIWVRCGCFFGDIEQFREQVKKTRKGRIRKEYLMIANFVEIKWM